MDGKFDLGFMKFRASLPVQDAPLVPRIRMKPNRIPKYSLLEKRLRKEFSRRQVGDRIPTVRELMRKHRVSLATVTHAMGNLERDGLIVRKVGSGTFITRPARGSGDQRFIGLMVPTINNDFFGRILHGLADRLAQKHWHVLVKPVQQQLENLTYHLDQLEKVAARGLIYVPVTAPDETEYFSLNRQFLEKFAARNWPGVILDQEFSHGDFPCVRADHAAGARLVADHLARLGHRDVAFVHAAYSTTAESRWQAFRERARKHGVRAVRIFQAGLTNDLPAIRSTVSRILESKPRITAVFAVSDLIAYHLLFEFQRRDVRVPEDLSVAGYDNIDLARFADPPLTTVNQPLEEIGERAGELILQQFEKPTPRPASVVLPINLIERSSTAPVSKA